MMEENASAAQHPLVICKVSRIVTDLDYSINYLEKVHFEEIQKDVVLHYCTIDSLIKIGEMLTFVRNNRRFNLTEHEAGVVKEFINFRNDMLHGENIYSTTSDDNRLGKERFVYYNQC